MKKNEIIRIKITSYSNDGAGVGRYEGMAVFVPYTAVGDELDVRVVQVRKSYAYGIIDKIIIPADVRISVDCPCFGKCGGCNFRHVSYEEELRAKQRFVVDALERIGNIKKEISQIIGSPQIDYYRNKVQYPVCSADNRLFPAFYQPRSHRPLDISAYCKLQPGLMNTIAVDVCNIMTEVKETAYNEETKEGNIRHILIRKSSIDNSILLCVVCRSGFLVEERYLVSEITRLHPEIKTIIINKNVTKGNEILSEDHRVIYGSGYIEDSINEVPVNISYDSFYQINQKSTELLYRCIKEFASLNNENVVVDLYCGAGTIGLSCCDRNVNLFGVDVVKKSIESAREAAAKLGYTNTHFIEGDSSFLESLLDNGVEPDLIITDPPRKGCSLSVLQSIIRSNTRKIIMVSCNPTTLARDLKVLINGGYEIQNIQPVDMFPRTKHVETVVMMSRGGQVKVQ